MAEINPFDPKYMTGEMREFLAFQALERQEQQCIPWVAAAERADFEELHRLLPLTEDISGFEPVYGSSALNAAAREGHLAVVEWLLQQGADLEVGDMQANTPLIVAAYYRKVDVALRLMELGADIHAQNEFGNTALHEAASGGDLSLVQELLKRGAHPEGFRKIQGRWRGKAWRPLHGAVREGHLEVARLLREKGASWPATTERGSTLLHLAAFGGNARLAQWLLSQGQGDFEATDEESRTPVEVARFHGNKTMLRYLTFYKRQRARLKQTSVRKKRADKKA